MSTSTTHAPGCGDTTGMQPITGTSPRAQAWSCTACDTSWAISVINPHLPTGYLTDVAAAVEEVERLRWILRQVVLLATDAPTITDQQLRTRLLELAESGGTR